MMDGETRFATGRPTVDQPTGLHFSVRKEAAAIQRRFAPDAKDRLAICRGFLASTDDPNAPDLDALSPGDRYYWISALYMLLMPARRRQRLAAFFTPPHLCQHVLDRLEYFGADPLTHTVLDPAAGGAAFLVPWALRLTAGGLKQKWSLAEVRSAARSQLAGIEIEPGLARLCEDLLRDALGILDDAEPPASDRIVRRGNALRGSVGDRRFDVVVCNPPYGRVFRPSPILKKRWSAVICESHVNTYALFVAASIERAKDDGLIALVIPTSFIGGPYFSALRAHILDTCHVLGISLIERRSDEFLDVTQDTCTLFLRKRGKRVHDILPACLLVHPDGSTDCLGTIDTPEAGSRPWAIPVAGADSSSQFDDRLATLHDYGFAVRSGYFVWNRSRHQMTDRIEPEPGELPLIWAHNVKPCQPVQITSRHSPGLRTFVKLPTGSSVAVQSPAIVLQRTTNRAQQRRLVPSLICQDLLDQYGGVVTENHTLVIAPIDSTPAIDIATLSKLLHSKPVDDRYRGISGSVSISAKLLRQLRLPRPDILLAEIARNGQLTDDAVTAAYASTLTEPQPHVLSVGWEESRQEG